MPVDLRCCHPETGPFLDMACIAARRASDGSADVSVRMVRSIWIFVPPLDMAGIAARHASDDSTDVSCCHPEASNLRLCARSLLRLHQAPLQ
mmetsp:Transcript_68420/g.119804  ORF Transcript_68420/g.119804 Transcript_68420/m.119804 type:complete len:92 (-) Transcript_68420:46-321(-)